MELVWSTWSLPVAVRHSRLHNRSGGESSYDPFGVIHWIHCMFKSGFLVDEDLFDLENDLALEFLQVLFLRSGELSELQVLGLRLQILEREMAEVC